MTDAAVIVRFYNGVDPWSLTPQQFDALLDRIGEIMEMETGQVDHRTRIERMARRRGEDD